MVRSRLRATCASTKLCVLLISSTLVGASQLTAQNSDSAHVSKTFFTRRDVVLTGAAIVGTVAISRFDERIAHWSQTPSVQGAQSRHDLVDALTHVNETPLTIGAVVTYGVGRLG